MSHATVDATDRTDPYLVSANRFFAIVLGLLFLFSLALGQWHGMMVVALVVGLPAAAIPSAFIFLAPAVPFTRMLVGAAFMVFCGLHIHEAHGMTEMHFGVFVLLALLLVYRDWKVIVVAAAVIAVHHLSFCLLQMAGYGVMCFPKASLGLVVVHAAYVVVESGALCYLAALLRAERIHTARSEDMARAQAEAMQALISQTRAALQAITDSSGTLAASSAAIARGAQEQAASLEQTAASLEQITATMRQSAGSGREAKALALASGQEAQHGGSVVAEAVRAMAEIDESSAKISDIIGTIDEIAFQTNLLAVNAAVEAARAGAEGRGFAVVASEVRSLSLRTSEAAKSIKGLIQDSLRKVQKGTELVDRSGKTLGGIVFSVKRVTEIVEHMAAASEQQSLGIDQLNRAVESIDSVTQNNSAETEAVAFSADAVSKNVAALFRLVADAETGSSRVDPQRVDGHLPLQQGGSSADRGFQTAVRVRVETGPPREVPAGRS